MHFTRTFTTIVAVVTLASAFIGALPEGALAGNNNGANLQTGGNGHGNNGCGNGNGGPSGTKDCDKNQKDDSPNDLKIDIGRDLSSKDFDNVVAISRSGGYSNRSESDEEGSKSVSSSNRSESNEKRSKSAGYSNRSESNEERSKSVGSSNRSGTNTVSTLSSVSLAGVSNASRTQAASTSLKQVPIPTMLPGVVLLGACAIAAKIKTAPSRA